MALKLYMVGVVVKDMSKAVEFYRRLGLEIPEGSEAQHNVAVPMGDLTFIINTRKLNAKWDAANTEPAQGGYSTFLEFYLETREAVDAKYNELVNYGYESHFAPYVTSFNMYFAMVKDPDGNAVLLSGETGE